MIGRVSLQCAGIASAASRRSRHGLGAEMNVVAFAMAPEFIDLQVAE